MLQKLATTSFWLLSYMAVKALANNGAELEAVRQGPLKAVDLGLKKETGSPILQLCQVNLKLIMAGTLHLDRPCGLTGVHDKAHRASLATGNNQVWCYIQPKQIFNRSSVISYTLAISFLCEMKFGGHESSNKKHGDFYDM
ncbi:hypothetical protein FRX31_006480 [Thalictrum thalictroides]|uniref:Uncharacterized protein n=1 Tax=Thalictrum thalictroides TaxID=46969 RepID=A0A7J6X3H8_THATH|nr:hypothetical protein FRX31_006480 [Thalictrum thalictroides]